MSYCLLIPHYNHERQFIAFLPQLVASGLPLVIVDDGSSAESCAQVAAASATYSNVHFYALRRNRGKGGAVKAGLVFARSLGFSHALQIDADGQHNVADIEKFVQLSQQHPEAIICGKPVFDASAPKARVYGRKVTDFWVALETLSLKIKDGLCGFRVYPLAQIEQVLDHYFVGNRMDFDTELLVKAVWLNTRLIFINTQVIYPAQSVSHFNYLRDNLLLIKLHSRLMLGMLVRLPLLLWQRLRGN
ncbi:putative glycosyltransferase [Cellvibrio sp. BR]|jgi:glycosyltransferase involved in cell wall biosynthesis|uniref:glycosyltransferase family 2 protein n=1 Tax=unclassified Cellvibrio TaxID=2624793 RepID=UPI0002600EAE|nr:MULTISPECIES: glycosyltransferase family 2 protein [unclassified Cellvibrio]EIK46003.1 putative glycosyltransferase [Cellvibrio sp. BR]QEY11864.1 glycosyltransferase family 2 protein [Cellvibrio sp. KY-YJ-3]